MDIHFTALKRKNSLFFTVPEIDFSLQLLEALQLYEKTPAIGASIIADQDRHTKLKKAMRRASTVIDNLNVISMETMSLIYKAQLDQVMKEKLYDFNEYTIDSTASKGNSEHPVESKLMSCLVERTKSDMADLQKVIDAGQAGDEQLRLSHREWVEQSLGGDDRRRSEWTKAIAVGSEIFVSQIKQQMGINLLKGIVEHVNDAHILHGPESAYSVHFGGEKVDLSHENTVYI